MGDGCGCLLCGGRGRGGGRGGGAGAFGGSRGRAGGGWRWDGGLNDASDDEGNSPQGAEMEPPR